MKHGVWGLLVVAALMMFGCADYIYDETPPDPVTLSVSTLTDSTVTLTWSYTDIEEFKGYEVRYSKTSSVVDGSSPIVDTLTYRVDTTITVMKLDPRTKYYFRVNLLTTTGLFSPSSIVDATTLTNIPTAVKIASIDTITNSSAILKWTKSVYPDFERYRIFVDSLKRVDTNSTPAHDYKQNDSSTNRFIIPDLAPATKYYVRIHVENKQGMLLYSSAIDSFTTASNVPAAVEMNTIRSTQCTDSSIIISWKKSTEKDVAGYIICRDTADAVTLADSIPIVKDTVDTILSLTPNTDYYFAVAVRDSAGNISPLSVVETGRTLQRDTASYPIYTYPAASITDSSAILSWTPTHPVGFVAYRLVVDSVKQGLNDSEWVNTDSSKTSTFITDLSAGKKYYFRVYLETTHGLVSSSSIDSFTTIDVPKAITWNNVIIPSDQIFDTSVVLIWTASVSPNIKQYHVCMSTTSSVSLADSIKAVTENNYTATDLTPNTPYWFAIIAENEFGMLSPLSEVRYAITKPSP